MKPKMKLLVLGVGLVAVFVLGTAAMACAQAPQIEWLRRSFAGGGTSGLVGGAEAFASGLVSAARAFSGRDGSGTDDDFDAKVVPNRSPVADAGNNVLIRSDEQATVVLSGTAGDPDNDFLIYRWVEGTTQLGAGQVGPDGTASLNLGAIYPLSLGAHTIILEVDDGYGTSSDSLILTVENSSPTVAPSGGGTFQVNTPVMPGGQLADYDGDLLSYRWLEEGVVFGSGTVQSIAGGTPVTLPQSVLSGLTVGTHTLALEVDDGTNVPTATVIIVDIIDTIAPALAPVADRTILWPPDHGMVPVTIAVNANGNSGTPVTLQVAVLCNEFEEGETYWTEPVVDQTRGSVSLRLLVDRLAKGTGRSYTVAIIATDEAGNFSSAGVQIIVPHDRGKE